MIPERVCQSRWILIWIFGLSIYQIFCRPSMSSPIYWRMQSLCYYENIEFFFSLTWYQELRVFNNKKKERKKHTRRRSTLTTGQPRCRHRHLRPSFPPSSIPLPSFHLVGSSLLLLPLLRPKKKRSDSGCSHRNHFFILSGCRPSTTLSTITFDLDLSIAHRKGNRSTVHPLSHFVSYDHLHLMYPTFVMSLSSVICCDSS